MSNVLREFLLERGISPDPQTIIVSKRMTPKARLKKEIKILNKSRFRTNREITLELANILVCPKCNSRFKKRTLMPLVRYMPTIEMLRRYYGIYIADEFRCMECGHVYQSPSELANQQEERE